ncbi:MAG: 16S rRNA (guanine(527)-N(7))-methyltransferase RsmG [Nitrospinaceae bacterium]
MILDAIFRLLEDKRLGLRETSDPARVAAQLESYLVLWKKWNSRINLTSEKDEIAVLEKHIFDSLQYARAIDPCSQCIDIGSGAGFPGIPLKMIFPELVLVLAESRRKRANFLRTVVRTLEWKDIEVVHQRVEELGEEYRGRFDTVLFRSVGPLINCLELGAPFLRGGGRIVLKKALSSAEEQESIQSPHSLSLKEEILVEGMDGIRSRLLIYEKCST